MSRTGGPTPRDVRLADAPEVGGKAASLGELLAAGVRVPDGVVLTAGVAEMTAEDRTALLRAGVGDLGVGPVRGPFQRDRGGRRRPLVCRHLRVRAGRVGGGARRGDGPMPRQRPRGPRRRIRVHRRRPTIMAVIVQQMVRPVAAGVVLTADPSMAIGASASSPQSAGLGERLVSGEAASATNGSSMATSPPHADSPERAIERRQARRVAGEARRIAAARGTPQDIEWAIDADDTRLDPPGPADDGAAARRVVGRARAGAYTRTLRFGEWIAEPVTPLFESWLLSRDGGAPARAAPGVDRAACPAAVPRHRQRLVLLLAQLALRTRPWLAASRAWSGTSFGTRAGSPGSSRRPFAMACRSSSGSGERTCSRATGRRSRPRKPAWRRCRSLELPALIDELADLAGEYFASLAALGGAAYKMEMNLARFYRRHLGKSLGGSHLPLLAGFEPPA